MLAVVLERGTLRVEHDYPTPSLEPRYPLARADDAFAHAARSGTLEGIIEGTEPE